MTDRTVPSSASVLRTLVLVTWRRLLRGRALWVSVLIALLPVLLAAALRGRESGPAELVQFLVMALLPPMFVASSLGEEIEDRTTTYLWSRPLARWTIVIGKLLALAPIAILLVVGGFVLTFQITASKMPPALGLAGIAGGTFTIAAMSAGIATLVPKHGMALSLIYLVVFDIALGLLPASINHISITRQVRLLTFDVTEGIAVPAITLAAISCMWLALALWRIRRLES